MRRGWIGAALLAVLLLGGMSALLGLQRWQQEMDGALVQAGNQALAGNWEQSEALTAQVKALWERGSPWAAALCHQGALEQIEELLCRLEEDTPRDPLVFAALCRETSRQLRALVQSHSPSWRNLL